MGYRSLCNPFVFLGCLWVPVSRIYHQPAVIFIQPLTRFLHIFLLLIKTLLYIYFSSLMRNIGYGLLEYKRCFGQVIISAIWSHGRCIKFSGSLLKNDKYKFFADSGSPVEE